MPHCSSKLSGQPLSKLESCPKLSGQVLAKGVPPIAVGRELDASRCIHFWNIKHVVIPLDFPAPLPLGIRLQLHLAPPRVKQERN